jgi:MarR family transcriptional regulator for hemolysin
MKNTSNSRFGFLVHDVARLMRWNFDRRSQGLGPTLAQWSVLAHLQRGEGVTQTTLAQLMNITPITLARHVDRLESKDWVIRKDDPKDRRAKRVYLTDKVAPVLSSLQKLGRKVRKQALTGISAEEEAQLIDVLTRIRENLTESGGPSDGR